VTMGATQLKAHGCHVHTYTLVDSWVPPFAISHCSFIFGCCVDATWAPIATPPLFDLMDSSVIAK